MNIFYSRFQITILLCLLLLSGTVSAQFPAPDASPLFGRGSVAGTAATAGAGGAFSSVGGDLGSINLNPAGLGIYKSSDICLTLGLRTSADQSTYDGSIMKTPHVSPEIPQGGMVFIKKLHNERGVKSLAFAVNFEGSNFFSRNQNFGAYNTTNSLIDNYAQLYNHGNTPATTLDAALLYSANILGYNPTTNVFSSNIKTPVQQAGYLDTRGFSGKVSLGMGANISDKLYFGFTLAVPILNYTVNTQMTETNANDSVTQFQYYTLNSSATEAGAGFTGSLGVIYQPASWVRVGISYSLPTWLFLTENYKSALTASFDSTGAGSIPTQYNPAFSYRIRMPMKGVAGASFYFAENSFFSADYEIQNVGAIHYSIPNDTFGVMPYYNTYLKSTYTFTHTIKAGIQGAYKKLRIRAGYSYITSPFKSGQNYVLQYSPSLGSYNEAVQTGTFGLGLVFKRFYMDMAYVFTYTKDGLSPTYQSFQIPLDEIHSTYMAHSVLLTLGFRIISKKDNSSTTPAKQQRRSSDQLPRYIDPGDKY
jgi:hypothetical protein